MTTGTVADDVVAAWYSGSYATAAGPAVAGYTDALLWQALSFTKPPGYCGGETGYWADSAVLTRVVGPPWRTSKRMWSSSARASPERCSRRGSPMRG